MSENRRVLIILGNGFSIDFLQHMNVSEEIDTCDLFRHGACVPWPENDSRGFLSYKNCPNLWQLGARPYMGLKRGLQLMEDILTCTNVASLRMDAPEGIYWKAYCELLLYLKFLFVYYDGLLSVDSKIDNWPWAQFFRRLNADVTIDSVEIVTFNYDAWLERVLQHLKIDFTIAKSDDEQPECRFRVCKPHGSISFCHTKKSDKAAFDIQYNPNVLDTRMADIVVKYEELAENYVATAMIPPAGDPNRIRKSWAGEQKESGLKWAESAKQTYLCGISYWHVDRDEIDNLLTALPSDVMITQVNPLPPEALNAVLSSLFKNYIYFPDSRNLL